MPPKWQNAAFPFAEHNTKYMPKMAFKICVLFAHRMANEQIDGGAFKASVAAAATAATATTTTESKRQDNYRAILVNGSADQLF